MAYVNLPPKITDASVTLTFSPDNATASGAYWGYCTVADVGYEFPQKASMVNLTNSVMGQEITYAAFELHKMLEHYYVMPYAGNDAGIYATLRDLNCKLAVSTIIERYYQGSEPNLSEDATLRKSWVAGKIADIQNGREQWGIPFGDAMPQAMAPVYDLSRGATVYPNPTGSPISGQADPNAQTPIFSISRTPYRSDMM